MHETVPHIANRRRFVAPHAIQNDVAHSGFDNRFKTPRLRLNHAGQVANIGHRLDPAGPAAKKENYPAH